MPTELLTEISLSEFLKTHKSQIIAACESEDSSKTILNISNIENEVSVLIGPEGGFSEAEVEMLKSMDNVHSVSLGKSVLRSEIAVISALACVQMVR